MPQRYIDAIIKQLASHDYSPLKPRQLARAMGIDEEEYGTFRDAIKMLRDTGRVILGSKHALTLPEISDKITGTYRANPRGFGFVLPQTPNSHGDLYIPEGENAGAMSGDLVRAQVFQRGVRAGEAMYHGRVIQIIERGSAKIVGTLQKSGANFILLPDGKSFTAPILLPDVGPGAQVAQKVVVEITIYPQPGELARGVIVENLGAAGAIEAETISVIRAHGLPHVFPEEVFEEARRRTAAFRPDDIGSREDLTGLTIVTIDPPDARDFDDAISLEEGDDGRFTLGVHIADVSHFVVEGGALDAEARLRSNSVYFPRRVIPMLPEVLSNGVCSLQEGQRRFCKSAFMHYDEDGNLLGTKLAETVICSAKRLHYIEAQGILEGKTGGYSPAVVELLRRMDSLAKRIQARRKKAGMIHLDLVEVEPILDEAGAVIDAEPEDQSFTHTIIEMFMVEANEAVAATLDRRGIAFLRRVHPSPDLAASTQLASFVRVCGHKLSRNMSRPEVQQLIETVRGRPEAHAINLAVLKSFQQATYSPMTVGHYALASDNYCHFTSPIRRYPDLTVHRLFAQVARGQVVPPQDISELVRLGENCSAAERRADAAENELTTVLVLGLMAKKIGEEFDGVVTGVTNFGIFVELPRYGCEGLVRMEELGDDWWELYPKSGEIRGERSGRRYRIGDTAKVRIMSVNIPARQLNLALAGDQKKRKPKEHPGGTAKSKGKPKPNKGPAKRGKRRGR